MDEDDFMTDAEWEDLEALDPLDEEEFEDELEDEDEDEDEDEEFEDDLEAYEHAVDLGDAFRDVLHEDYAELSPEETDQALYEVFESLTPAESFSLAKVLGGVRKTAQDPTFRQISGTALPILGTALGGPVGGTLGGVAGQALAGAPPASTAPAVAAVAPPTAPAPVAAARPAAAQKALVATYLPAVQQALAAKAFDPHGTTTVAGGIPVTKVIKMLNDLLGKAAAEAEAEDFLDGSEDMDDYEALYDELVWAEDEDLSDAAGLS